MEKDIFKELLFLWHIRKVQKYIWNSFFDECDDARVVFLKCSWTLTRKLFSRLFFWYRNIETMGKISQSSWKILFMYNWHLLIAVLQSYDVQTDLRCIHFFHTYHVFVQFHIRYWCDHSHVPSHIHLYFYFRIVCKALKTELLPVTFRARVQWFHRFKNCFVENELSSNLKYWLKN